MIDEKKLIKWAELVRDDYKRCPDSCYEADVVQYIIDGIIKQPKGGEWIPCSERLPEEKGEYLVSFGKNTKTVIETFDGVCFSERNYFLQPEAWMPLPEPYKERSEE